MTIEAVPNAPGTKVLIVDDDTVNLEMFCRRLAMRGYEVTPARSAQEAREAIWKSSPDIILLDVNMPDVSGLELLDQLRDDDNTSKIPVILVSAQASSEAVVRGLQQGANDYVTKPVDMPILLARLEMQVKMASMMAQLETQKEMLAKLATYDDLTGALNRRSMFETLRADLARSVRYGHNLSVLMMDLDHFKRVNDTYGHQAGDQVLKQFAKRVTKVLRSTDSLCRYGGEEFLALLPETSPESALRAAEHIRRSIEAEPFRYDETIIQMTVSIGIATYMHPGIRQPTELLDLADQALYNAKNSGRNRVCSIHANRDECTPWPKVVETRILYGRRAGD